MKRQRRPRSRGFTIAEVLVAMVLTGIVVAGVLRALTAQKRFYARQARILDARHAMRASTTILSSEVRDLSSLDGDLYSIGLDSISLRSTVGFGVVCQTDVAGGRLALTQVSGHFFLEGSDSLQVFVESSVRDDDDAWATLGITGIASSGLNCASGATPARVVTISGDLTNVWVGSPIRLLRPYVYRLFDSGDGYWWLGRRLRSASDFVPVAGPLAPPSDQGLILTYYKADGDPTTNPNLVARVQITVRAPTYKSASDPDYQTMNTSTYLRSDG